ncbi:MAG TPA: hypothetical protein VE136_04015 [Anaerolineales bacterium]|nr:hypothetical protein [Anaerolineales bacterium]
MKGQIQKQKNKRKGLKWLPGPLILAGVIAVGLALVTAAGGTAYALNSENHDAFCASCHTEPENQFYQNSLQSPPTTLAAFHFQKNVRCIECHSGSGIFGRLQGLEQGAQDLIAYERGNYHHPAITTNPLGDGSCLKCHAEVTRNNSFNNHFHVFLAQWQSLDPNAAHCVDCHTSHSAAQEAQGYLTVATVQQECQACHAVAGGD